MNCQGKAVAISPLRVSSLEELIGRFIRLWSCLQNKNLVKYQNSAVMFCLCLHDSIMSVYFCWWESDIFHPVSVEFNHFCAGMYFTFVN